MYLRSSVVNVVAKWRKLRWRWLLDCDVHVDLPLKEPRGDWPRHRCCSLRHLGPRDGGGRHRVMGWKRRRTWLRVERMLIRSMLSMPSSVVATRWRSAQLVRRQHAISNQHAISGAAEARSPLGLVHWQR